MIESIKEKIMTWNQPLIPPKHLRFDGPPGIETFKRNAQEFFDYYVNLCELNPDESILDVGSGIGRKTFLLTEYLNKNGSYDGFDIARAGIDWCAQRYKKHKNFRFKFVDIFNKHYNPTGKIRASEFTFPYPSESFDLVVLNSVFTHMLLLDMDHYLSEIRRVLKRGGRCLLSYFLLNEESFNLIKSGKSTIDFQEFGDCWVADKNTPEIATGYDQAIVFKLIERHGFKVKSINYGSWCGRSKFLSYQDLIVIQLEMSRGG